jgi:hypothetical protein
MICVGNVAHVRVLVGEMRDGVGRTCTGLVLVGELRDGVGRTWTGVVWCRGKWEAFVGKMINLKLF